MGVDIDIANECAAPVATAFAYADDYRNATNWLSGIQKFEPAGDQDQGLGAVFDASMHVGATLHSTIKVDGWVENELISFEAIKGFPVRSVWNFEAVDENTTRIRAHIHYDLPGGLAGKALGRIIEPFVKLSVKHSSAALRKCIEAAAASA